MPDSTNRVKAILQFAGRQTGDRIKGAAAAICIFSVAAYSEQVDTAFTKTDIHPPPGRVVLTVQEGTALKKNQLPTWTVILILFAGCASVPTKDIRIDAQADPQVSFSGYRTYAWLGAAAIVNDPHGRWEPPRFDADAEIMFLIDRELRKRGMSENKNNPDLIVAFAAGIDMDALGLKSNPETQSNMPANVPQGGLAVVLADRQTGFVIWVGTAIAELQENPDTRTVKARLNHAITKMFERLPK